MRSVTARIKGLYGASPLHLLLLLGCFALVGYVIDLIGPAELWNPSVWWKSILVWFVGAIIAHDLVLFPLYALADRLLGAGSRAVSRRGGNNSPPRVSPLNYLRIPVLGAGLLFVLYLPGIIKQGGNTYLRDTGQTQGPFLQRWLLITAAMFLISAVAYAGRTGYLRRRDASIRRTNHDRHTEA
jgi:hypothetical protein